MKILMLLESNFPPDTRVENEINALLESGHEVHMACVKTKRDSREKKFGKTIIHRMGLNELARKSSVAALSFPLYFKVWRKFVQQLMDSHHFDAVHVHDLQLARIGYEMKKRYGVEFVLDLHENWPALLKISEHTKSFLGSLLFSEKQWKNYERKYVRLADKVIVVVEEAKERIQSLGVAPDKIYVVSNTQNLEEFNFEIPAKEHDKVVFTYAGGITFHRGLQYVLKAAAQLDALDFEIRIVGAGRFLDKLQELAKALNIEGKVHFLGWQNRDALLKIVFESDVALIPHIKSAHTDSTIPHKLFQYLYAEKPILASNCCPIERILRETGGGWTYSFDDVNELAMIMRQIIQKEYQLKDFANGKEAVLTKYNWNVDKANLLEVYQ